MNGDSSPAAPEEQLSELFGGYRAEWLKGQIFDLFTEPSYFPELKTSRPCVLIGGRGTGKTTVLRGLSFEGQFALNGHEQSTVQAWKFYGLYYRVNTNVVTAFRGKELSEERWVPIFAHYFNLALCDLVLSFLEWYQLTTEHVIEFDQRVYTRLSTSVHIDEATSLKDLSDFLTLARIKFEAYINNVAGEPTPPLSMQGVPIDILISALVALPQFNNKTFFFLIDEYENFEPYQQQVINTLIKHSGENYTFKLGVKELGIRRRTTLNLNEQLISPADYVRIDIAEKLSGEHFKEFAAKVVNDRIGRLLIPGISVVPDIEILLPGLTEDEEAERLGVEAALAELRAALSLDKHYAEVIGSLEPLKFYFLTTWAESTKTPISRLLDEYVADTRSWDSRYTNYKHSMLFNIKRGKRGIRRYYCGWDTFTYLAASNIRYLLELVDQSLLAHVRDKGSLAEPVSAETQTIAAQGVGRKNLSELEGLAVSGAQLTKLLLGLGRVFGQMATDPIGHAPEVNQFELSSLEEWSGDPDSSYQRVLRLLDSAIMHLALRRWPGNKLSTESDTRDYDYAIHPIFSAFFVFSYRRKRKMPLLADEILGLVNAPRKTIREILAKHNREEEPLPEQLQIFRAYFDGVA